MADAVLEPIEVTGPTVAETLPDEVDKDSDVLASRELENGIVVVKPCKVPELVLGASVEDRVEVLLVLTGLPARDDVELKLLKGEE